MDRRRQKLATIVNQTGIYKGAGEGPLSVEQRAQLQVQVEQIFSMFSRFVQSAHGEKLDATALQGQCEIGQNA